MRLWPVDAEVALRPVGPDIVPELFRLVDRSRPHLRRYLAWVDATRSEEDVRRFVAAAVAQFARGLGVHCAILWRGELVGAIGQDPIDAANRLCHLGYWLAEPYQGRGIAIRAARAMLHLAFLRQGLHRVEIRCAADNLRSRRLAERLGFALEGRLREALWVEGRPTDALLFGLVRTRWPGSGLSPSWPDAAPAR